MKTLLFFGSISFLIFLSGCKDHEIPKPVNEEELITTLELKFTEAVEGGEIIVFTWKDIDGSFSTPPAIDNITLKAHTIYKLELNLLDESTTPAGNVAEEIEEESEDHQFFFQSNGLELSFQYDDVDTEGKPLGLSNTVFIEHASTGTLTVILRHQPDKSASGVSDGDVTNAGGETDIEATFPVTIIE
jgi:hypothetical protein